MTAGLTFTNFRTWPAAHGKVMVFAYCPEARWDAYAFVPSGPDVLAIARERFERLSPPSA